MTTPNFANIAAYEQKNQPRPFVIVQIDNGERGSPVLMTAPATEANPAYYNEWLRRISKRRTEGKAAKEASADLTKRSRDEDRALIGQYCVTGWENVLDADGKDVPFSRENAIAFLAVLPDWIFDEYRTWAMNPMAFILGSTVTSDDETALGN